MKRNWILLLALGALLPGLLLAQDKPKKSKQKVVIIRKSVDKDGAPDGRRHSKVIVIQGDDDDEEAMPFVPEEGRPALELEAFEAFPNPADNQLTVRFTGLPAPVTIRLLDAAGQQVYKEYIKDFNGAYDQRIGLEGVPKGLLLLTVEQEGRVFTEKVMATGR